MSKIVKNNTNSSVEVSDVGVAVPASGQYVLNTTEYLIWADSADIVTLVGDGTLTVNDGSVDLGISEGIDLIKGIFQKHRIIGDTDGTLIGNDGDRLKVAASLPDYEDGTTDALKIIDYAHHEIHAGSAYMHTDTVTLGNSQTYGIVFTTPNTAKQCHLVFAFRAPGETRIDLYENPTNVVTGSSLNVFNKNRNSSKVNTTVLNTFTSSDDNGTLLFTEFFDRVTQDVSTSRNIGEWILKSNEEYILLITSGSNSNQISWLIEWYEHTDPTV